jgi:hypothetical protein
MTSNITLYYDACVRAGQPDFEDRERQSYVEYDSKTYYYDLSYSDVNLSHWAEFVDINFNSPMSYGVTEHGVFWGREI